MDRLYGSPNELSTKESIVDPVDFINDHEHGKQIFIGRNNTEIWAHAGSNVVFDCLVGRPNLEDHGPVSSLLYCLTFALNFPAKIRQILVPEYLLFTYSYSTPNLYSHF